MTNAVMSAAAANICAFCSVSTSHVCIMPDLLQMGFNFKINNKNTISIARMSYTKHGKKCKQETIILYT